MALGGKYKEPTQQMMDKIIEGKVKKRLSDICLLSQVRVFICMFYLIFSLFHFISFFILFCFAFFIFMFLFDRTMFIYCYCYYCPPFFLHSFFSLFLYSYFPLLLILCDLVPYRLFYSPFYLTWSFPTFLCYIFLHSFVLSYLFFLTSFISSYLPPFISSFLPSSHSTLTPSLSPSFPPPIPPSQPHVAEEGSPVVEDFINQASAAVGGKIKISYFERWNLGQTEKPPTTTEQK